MVLLFYHLFPAVAEWSSMHPLVLVQRFGVCVCVCDLVISLLDVLL